MKRTSILILLVAILSIPSLVKAQKKGKEFSGTIEFALSYQGVDPAQEAQMPKTLTMLISGNKSKTILDAGMYALHTITDGDAEVLIIYLDYMGQKMAYKQTKADIDTKNKDAVAPTIKFSEETKVIAGYTCKKAEIITKDEETLEEYVTTVWYTEELGVSDKVDFANPNKGIPGVTLESSSKQGESGQTMTATAVKKGKIKSTDFLLPADAKEMTLEEFKAMFGGGGDDE